MVVIIVCATFFRGAHFMLHPSNENLRAFEANKYPPHAHKNCQKINSWKRNASLLTLIGIDALRKSLTFVGTTFAVSPKGET
jgi:hypothetical protein